jgi:(hydroxyamino)benzene mutase
VQFVKEMESPIDATNWSSREGRRMHQLGLLLLLFGPLIGFVVPAFAAPRRGLTAHVLGVMQGILLIVIGLLWPKLKLARTASGIGFWMVVYGCFVSWAVTVLAAAWGVGSSMMPVAAPSLCRVSSALYA